MAFIRRPYLRVFLAVMWMMLTGSYTLPGFVTGFLMATLVFALLAAPVVHLSPIQFGGLRPLVRWSAAALELLTYFIWELFKANHQVARLVLKRRPDLKPGVISMPLAARSSGQIALLTALITLTPGTIVLQVDSDDRTLYMHAIDATDEDEALRAPRRFEALILEVLP